ncbi:DUF2993 domain-containing protein [Actinoplanes sp. LDG1-06]|uniref:DUF2993 domain-containing protein n=1 Tax=Paractinoplanes ovalisporus TaxID=2810368 RepID=A0ABS2A6F5_9ACTN|nr:DUF2993 domain-containing protein [Actinoplanes ovalisporus]MBM2615432.1 DUF2993 domain-containing protein [Actinoplanes ovalisporus]
MIRKRKVILGAVAAAAVVVPLVADRVAAEVVERQVASRLKCAAGLSDVPEVTLGGFPAVTQLVSRSLDDVRVTADDVTAGKATLSHVAVAAQDLKLADGGLSARSISAEATVAWSALAGLGVAGAGDKSDSDAGGGSDSEPEPGSSSEPGSGSGAGGLLGGGLFGGGGLSGGGAAGPSVGQARIAGGDAAGRLVVEADVSMGGLSLPATVYADLALRGNALVVTPAEVELRGLGLRVPATRLPEAARAGRSVDLPTLPAGLAYREISATPDGLKVAVAGTDLKAAGDLASSGRPATTGIKRCGGGS